MTALWLRILRPATGSVATSTASMNGLYTFYTAKAAEAGFSP